jgi:acyl-CoA dehydrogenase
MPFDGYELPDELRMLSEAVAAFVHEQIVPVEAALPTDAREIPEEVLAPLQDRARDLGYWCFDAPAEHGGGGLDTFAGAVIAEQAAKHRYSFPLAGGGAFGYQPPVVLFNGSPEQIERYVVGTIRDRLKPFTAISEPAGGSDPARAISTTAVRRGDSYILNGRKMWATNADVADYGVLYARTDRGAGRGGLSAFVVEPDTPGFIVTPVPVLRNHWTTEVTLEDCEIPAENLVGEEGHGFALAQEWLVRGRIGLAAQAIGVAAESVRLAVEWARERETFGELLAGRQGVQFPLADSVVEINAARHLVWEAAWLDVEGKDARQAASIAKLYATEMGNRVVDRAMQVLGGMGMSKEMPLEHWYRDMRVARIVEGPSEIHRFLIARDLLGDRALRGRSSNQAAGAGAPGR